MLMMMMMMMMMIQFMMTSLLNDYVSVWCLCRVTWLVVLLLSSPYFM